ncbi:MAG: hypothetical protein M3R21_06185 [Candidatus Dormibacteraeota bacterium]|nr:hypothetical protein [Candidatus Dormibacteraeota bacterium]
MTRFPTLLAVVALVAVVLVSCTRSTGASTSAKPADVYAGAITPADVAVAVNDSANWWPSPPTFDVRPLDSASMPPQVRSETIVRFAHVGTAETLNALYRVWDSASLATAVMSTYQTALGTSLTGPRAGDQVFYYQQQLSFGAAPYVTAAYIRVGQTIIQTELSLTGSFAGPNQLGKIAVKIATRLKQVVGGKLHATPLPVIDTALLPPEGPYLTLLGSTRLPIEAAVVMVHSASPAAMATALHDAGLRTFVFGDYTLDNDTHMEARAGVLEFQSAKDAATWIDDIRGTNQLTADGFAAYYDDSTGQYFLLFIAGTKAAVFICRSVASTEAASRSCEATISPVGMSWKSRLSA